jgi:hypothetical protein
MKQISKNPRFFVTVIGMVMAAAMIACQVGGLGGAGGGGRATGQATPAGGQTLAPGDLNLPDPLTGLAALNSYHLSYANTVKGSQKGEAVDSSLAIEGQVSGEDESELVQQESTGLQPVYLQRVILAGAEYSQQEAKGVCRTAADSSEALLPDPAVKLPPVFGAKRVGPETIDGISTVRYQFDEAAVAWQAGQTGKAQGQVWLAVEGGYVVKYELTIQYPSGDFQGTRSWSYELSNINGETPVTLPEGCLPLITDIPMMEGATGAVQRPGFQKYSASATLEQVMAFYTQAMASSGWTQLPGVEPEGGKVTLEYVKPEADGGSRFAVIQAAEANGQTVVIVQTGHTQKPVTLDATPEPGTTPAAGNPTGTPGTGEEEATPETAVLPDDLPQYPGATVMVQTDEMLLLQTSDAPDKAAAFYKQAMADAGFTLESSQSINGIETQTWARGPVQIVVVIMQTESGSQITVAVG